MFYRELTESLNSWKNKTSRKPLILRGARQVGKTTLIKEFAKTFKRNIQVNLEKTEHKELFESQKPFNEIVNHLFFQFNIIRNNEPLLLFIDEIQNSPATVALLRYFYEDAPWIHVIAAGSLLESLIDNHISFPVGRVEYMAMRPCSYTEFLGALNEEQSLDIIKQWPIPDYAHNKLMSLFNRYTLIGGMPAIIENYAQYNDLVRLSQIYDDLLTGYSEDVEKYAKNASQTQYIRHILQTGMDMASERIKFEGFGFSNYRSREMKEAFNTLEKALLLELVYPTIKTAIPIQSNLKKSPRLIWFDTGLINYSAGIQKDILGSDDIHNVWRGKMAEHIVGQELISNNLSVRAKRNFWVREAKNSNAEIDFIIQHDNLIIPIEVKSGKSGHLKSLHQFMELAPHNIAIKISSEPFSIEEVTSPKNKTFRLLHIPFYLVSKIPSIIQKLL